MLISISCRLVAPAVEGGAEPPKPPRPPGRPGTSAARTATDELVQAKQPTLVSSFGFVPFFEVLRHIHCLLMARRLPVIARGKLFWDQNPALSIFESFQASLMTDLSILVRLCLCVSVASAKCIEPLAPIQSKHFPVTRRSSCTKTTTTCSARSTNAWSGSFIANRASTRIISQASTRPR